MARETVLAERRDGGVLLLTLSRPEKRNAFNSQAYHELRDALDQALADDAVHAVVLTGAGAAFCAGQDVAEMRDAASIDGASHGFPGFLERLCSFDKPLLAAVNGAASGLGLTMLLHCDVVYVGESARLRCPFVALGVVPEAGSSYLLPLIIGFQRAAEVLYTAEWIEAPRAVELGLAARLLPDATLVATALRKAREIAANPPLAVRRTKRLLLATRAAALREALGREQAAFAELLGSPESLAAIAAFFERPQAQLPRPTLRA